MYRAAFFIANRCQVVDWLTHHIQQAALYLVACRHRNRLAHIDYLHAAHQAVGAFHCHGAHGVFTNVLLYFENQLSAIGLGHLQCSVDGGHFIAFALKRHVHYRAYNLSNFSK